MTTHITATRENGWKSRLDLLAAEKDLARRSDEVARLRRQLPWVRVDKDYVFDGPDGRQTLADLFAGRRQLLVQHFMLHPGAGAGLQELLLHGRPRRRHDHSPGASRRHLRRHLARAARRDRALSQAHGLAVQCGCPRTAPTSTTILASVSRRKKWPKVKLITTTALWPHTGEELPGVSAFYKDDAGGVFHTYSTYGRGVEVMMGTYRMLDLMPKGRDELVGHNMAWVRHHDRYEPEAPAKTAPRGRLVLQGASVRMRP